MMAVRKLSVSLPEEVADAVVAAAERAGLTVSAWMTRAAANSARIEAGLAAVAEWEAEHGVIAAGELSQAAAVLADADARMFGGADDARLTG
ncbi:hypothetical protein C1I98_38345 [Spongiactinospora gelatinilytica]|uniref:Uncharacterized protein n=1 Tax=Spongiactinospora gelatinilytica TaxID=2666298 RepID=A0A2W2E3D6_9ACTN|nr:hypothetical protein [Spongiactinospora gelatinilytica]PZG18502.1 hypothetical protein C1I98_38345 [Spongiactinospora gelatinilytica]